MQKKKQHFTDKIPPFSFPLKTALKQIQSSPVHGQLSDQRDVGVVRRRRVVVVQVVQVSAVDREALTSELVTRIVFVQLRQGPLQLRTERRG